MAKIFYGKFGGGRPEGENSPKGKDPAKPEEQKPPSESYPDGPLMNLAKLMMEGNPRIAEIIPKTVWILAPVEEKARKALGARRLMEIAVIPETERERAASAVRDETDEELARLLQSADETDLASDRTRAFYPELCREVLNRMERAVEELKENLRKQK